MENAEGSFSMILWVVFSGFNCVNERFSRSWHSDNSVWLGWFVVMQSGWIYFSSLWKMFSFQSNWKLSASILPWDERQIKLPLALVWLQTEKGQARESPKYKSDRYLFSDFESREVSHLCFKKRTGSVLFFSGWISIYNLLILQSLWTPTVSWTLPEYMERSRWGRKNSRNKTVSLAVKKIVKAFELN